jgi:hypothetical protein
MNRFLVIPLAILLACSASVQAQGGAYTCADTVSVSMTTSSYDFTGSPYGLDGYNDDVGIFYVSGRLELDYNEYVALPSSCKSTAGSGLDFEFDLGDCSGHVTANETHINYAYYIWQKPMKNETGNPVISRYETHSIRFDCYYPREVTDQTAEQYITPNVIHTHYFNGYNLHEGTFTYRIGFANSTYNIDDVSAGEVVDVDDWMYIRAELDDGSADSSNYIAFKTCTAHETPTNSTSSHHYKLIRDYCVNDETWDEDHSIELVTSGSANYAGFKVRAFVWNDDAYAQHRSIGYPFKNPATPTPNAIYITCDITVCNNGALDSNESVISCQDYTSTCGAGTSNRRRRRRRSAAMESQQVISLMAGPMSVN